jgi:hypothetical protein
MIMLMMMDSRSADHVSHVIIAMGGHVKHRRIILKDVLCAIAMMNVPAGRFRQQLS